MAIGQLYTPGWSPVYLIDTEYLRLTLSGLQLTCVSTRPTGKTFTSAVSVSPLRKLTKSQTMYFEILVTGVIPKNQRGDCGLGIGVTSTHPSKLKKTASARDLPGVVLFGYEGVCVLNSGLGRREFKKDQWTGAAQLEVGDVVGLFAVMPAGDLVLVLNGEVVCDLCDCLPVDGAPLWALVDLAGNTTSVKWVPNPTVRPLLQYPSQPSPLLSPLTSSLSPIPTQMPLALPLGT